MPAQKYTHGLTTTFTAASRMYLGKACRLWRLRSCGCGGLRAVGHASVPRKHMYEQCFIGDGDAHKYFIKTSRSSVPPSELYILLSMGDISDCFVDCSISTTVARCTSYTHEPSAGFLHTMHYISARVWILRFFPFTFTPQWEGVGITSTAKTTLKPTYFRSRVPAVRYIFQCPSQSTLRVPAS